MIVITTPTGLIGHQDGADRREMKTAQLGARDGVQDSQVAACRFPGEHRDPPVGPEPLFDAEKFRHTMDRHDTASPFTWFCTLFDRR